MRCAMVSACRCHFVLRRRLFRRGLRTVRTHTHGTRTSRNGQQQMQCAGREQTSEDA